MKHLFAACALATLAACANMQPTPITEGGRRVMITQPLTATEAEHYEEIGPIHTSSGGFMEAGNEEETKNLMRNRASELGADILTIESLQHHPCEVNKSVDCVDLSGRAYRRKSAAVSSSAARPK